MNEVKVKCYLFRKAISKQWVASTNDLPLMSVTASEPEDALKRMQLLIIREVADRIESSDIPISSELEISLSFEIVNEGDAARLLHKDDELTF